MPFCLVWLLCGQYLRWGAGVHAVLAKNVFVGQPGVAAMLATKATGCESVRLWSHHALMRHSCTLLLLYHCMLPD
jgi:energy-converting hydrogenase Eha subunit H